MKYYLDTEFHEYKKNGIDTIELISIGIVAEDGREYYAISKDFNLKEAWNRYDIKIEQVSGDISHSGEYDRGNGCYSGIEFPGLRLSYQPTGASCSTLFF